jgi:hypothetical protein
MWSEILIPIIGFQDKISGFWALEGGKITWQKILVPILVFAIAVFIVIVIQFVAHIVYNFFKRLRGPK